LPHIDPGNVQGLVFRLYRYPVSRHLLFKITDASGARAMLRGLVPQVTTASRDLDGWPEPLINIGLTWRGLVAIGVVAAAEKGQFDDNFTAPPNASFSGTWDGRLKGDDIHLTVHVHCRTDAGLADATARLRAGAAESLQELQPVADGDPAITGRSLGSDRLHFGFRDGISQPTVNWDDLPDRPDLIDMRHFVLGYYSEAVQTYPRAGALADLVRDGTYGAFQWIYQNTAAFEAFLDRHAPAMAKAAGATDGRELLAAKMMGRWRDGTPMALSPATPDPAQVDSQTFSYAADPGGLRCPVTAHVRIANRRDQKLNPLVAAGFKSGGPYLLRRGMAYGDRLDGPVDDGKDRGLVGMFLCADLSHFTLVMKWINRTDFSPVFEPDRVACQDMMMGDRAFPGALNEGVIPIADDAPAVQLGALPAFVRIKGTAMVLLPSLAGLTKIAADPV
jgi:deferrochelatase/peroxidase EfeB